jgi:hypothetical protein
LAGLLRFDVSVSTVVVTQFGFADVHVMGEKSKLLAAA